MTGLEIIVAILLVWLLVLTYIVVILLKLHNTTSNIMQDLIDELMK